MIGVFGSNDFHGNSVLKDSGVVLHEIVRVYYRKLLPMTRYLPRKVCWVLNITKNFRQSTSWVQPS